MKPKKCKQCGEEFTPIYKSTQAMCSPECFYNSKAKTKKKVKRPNPISKKRAEQLKEYRKLRDKYLDEHSICEVHDCNNDTTNLHHKSGRTGETLCDTKYFMACCHTCHPKRIHENPKWARENGYLI